MTIVNGGELAAAALRTNDVDVVFALHGGHLDSLLFGLLDEKIRIVDVRHEAAAVHAADGYARSTGRLGVSVVTSGPGVTNAVTGVAVAEVDSSPQLVIAGAPPLRDEGRYVLQGGVDQVALMTPITKAALRVSDVDRIPEFVDRAVRIATRGRPGPVFLEIPVDVMFDRIAADRVPVFPGVRRPESGAPTAAQAAEIAEALERAARPVVLAGHGLLFDAADAAVARLAEQFSVPVYGNSRARGVLPYDHPLNCGNVAGLGGVGAQPDLVLVLGARTSQMTVGRRGAGVLGPDTRIIQVDANPEEAGRNVPVDVAFTGSIRAVAEAVCETGRTVPADRRGDWVARTKKTLYSLAPFEAEATEHEATRGDRGIHPYWFGRAVADNVAEDAIIVGDGSEAYHWVEPIARTAALGRWQGHGYFGCLGIGSPFAIGAQVAHPGVQVVQVVGDGSVGFNVQEFDTMVRHGLPVVTFVNSNCAWGISAHSQDALAGRRVVSDLPLTNFHEVMRAFGGYGELVTETAELGPAFRRAVESGLPACLNVVTDPEVVSPRVRLTNAAMATSVGLRPEDRDAPEGRPIAVPYYEPLER
ncbi:thiamine pyrophosphate-binding protein [Pseudonocardia halophobica]|uniref:Acetolactate synthase n=1 Tax=Pseudonocardia halophobica TaxID=29401 RepID=A0A9W6NV98_9PSEU|nr:thiamine pyrophosphate-binding protein [Pseudonocardia halophobica]GLL10634.1 acetolactate synthase [Pseudonocardia halophobica]